MNRQNIKHLSSREGFTLVELLIVIVVIAILAAITIVAYNGVQNKAHTTAANSAATEVIKKVALFQTEYNAYPTDLTVLQGSLAQTAVTTTDNKVPTNDPSYLASGDATVAGATLAAKPPKDNTVFFALCSTTGASVQYWDYSKATADNPQVLTTGTGC